MSRKNAIILYSILSGLFLLASPVLAMMYIFGVAGGANALSMGKNEGYQLIILGSLPAYPFCFLVYGWSSIASKTPLKIRNMFLIPLAGWTLFLCLHLLF